MTTFLNCMLAVYTIIFCIIGYKILFLTIHSFFSIPRLESLNSRLPDKWPHLSIIIVARNEEKTIESALSTLREQQYPSLEIIVINDRSTDTTETIIHKITKLDHRVKAEHVKTLPKEWLGKVHALNVGVQKASGDWMLFTDADVHFNQGILKKVIAFALESQCDHLALFPKVITHSFWLETLIHAFMSFFLLGTRVANLNKPGSKAFIGIGAFNLVKKSAFNKTPGFSWLRMEVADDVGLGYMLNRSGAKSSCAYALKDLSIAWYTSIQAMFKGLEKNLFRACNYNILRTLFIIFMIWSIVSAPLISILYFKGSYLMFFGILFYGSLFVEVVISTIRLKIPIIPSLFFQIGQIILTFALLRSAILCILKKGIIWRGSKYPIDQLKKGQRFKF